MVINAALYKIGSTVKHIGERGKVVGEKDHRFFRWMDYADKKMIYT